MAPPRPSRGPTPLPPYEPPTHPLTPSAQRTLQALPQTHSLARVKRHLDVATTSLTEMAGEVNDRYWQRADYVRRRKARRAGQGHEEEDGGAEEERERMREEVEALTGKMEESVRRVIDARARVEGTEGALVEVAANVVAGNGNGNAVAVAGTQSTLGASQFRQGRRKGRGRVRDEEGEESEFEEEDEEEAATQEGGNGQENVGPTQLLRKKMEEHKLRYDGLPLRTRYATNNSYIGFKRIVHDALHPGDDAPPLPNPSTWFPADPALHPSSNTRTRAHAYNANEHDDDDDLAIASERISIKCPLTLLPYKDPVTSTKCPHSFEKSAILDMIVRSAGRVGGERAVKCPVCDMMLTPSTLHPDPILLRKVNRIQAAEARAADDETTYSSDHEHHGGGGGGGHAPRHDGSRSAEEVVDDDAELYAPGAENGERMAARARSLVPRVKAERLASLTPGTAIATMQGGGRAGERERERERVGELVGTQTVTEGGAVVVDLGDGEGEDEDEDEDDMEGEDHQSMHEA